MTDPKRKRGRPPRTITSRDGTEMPLRDFGLTRKNISDFIAIASIPEDVLEQRLAAASTEPIAKARRMTSTQALCGSPANWARPIARRRCGIRPRWMTHARRW